LLAGGDYRIMTWEIYYSSKDHLIDIHAWGNVTAREMEYSGNEVVQYSEVKIVKSVLIDAMEVESIPGKTFFSGFIESLFDTEILTETKFALLTCKERWFDFKNIEKFCLGRGFPVKVFLRRQQALEWLKE
jgi:hypothetical protein